MRTPAGANETWRATCTVSTQHFSRRFLTIDGLPIGYPCGDRKGTGYVHQEEGAGCRGDADRGGGLITVGTLSASAATPQCGPNCIQIFSAKFGTYANPNFVETVFRGGKGRPADDPGPPQQLQPGGDLIATAPPSGDLFDFFAAGLVSAAVNQHYGNLNAAQIEYRPFGKPTGLCAGLATTAYQNEGLTLQPCTTPGTTV